MILATALLFAPVPSLAQGLPTTENGFNMIRMNTDDLSQYRSVDSMCIGENHDELMAFSDNGDSTVDLINPTADPEVASTKLRLSKAGAEGGQTSYWLIEPASNEAVFELHFVNPGTAGDPAKTPKATLSHINRLQQKSTNLDCLTGKNILYAGMDQNYRVMVMANPGADLFFLLSSIKEPGVAMHLTDGFWSSGKRGEIIFTFIEGSAVTSIKAAPHQRVEYPAWRTASPEGRQYSASPKGFFVADMEKLGHKSNRLPYGLVLHFERLEICRHLAGEASGNPKRNKQVTDSWNTAGCDEAKAQHASYVEQFSDNEPVSEILKTHRLNF
ncbi:MAG: hypothetical protein ABJF89_00485 [Parasphingorhabdus sp.]